MQKEKKQSQLLATLSQILKLYHKYLLYSLRSDIANERRLGMLENIRDRIRSIVDKEEFENNNFQKTTAEGQSNQSPDGDKRHRYQNKLVSRFLGRLTQKIKGYIEQFTGYQMPVFLAENLKTIQKMSSNLLLPQLLRNLFALGNEPSRQPRKQSRRNSSTQALVNQTENKGKCIMSTEKVVEKQEKKVGFMTSFNKRSNEIQQIINLFAITQIDEKELRKKYFAILQFWPQFPQQPLVKVSNSINSSGQFNHIIHATNSNFHKQQSNSQANQNKKINLLVSNVNYPNMGSNNPIFSEMMERNKGIYHMIKRYETVYEKYRKRGHVKILRDRQKQRSRSKQAVNIYNFHSEGALKGQLNDQMVDQNEKDIKKVTIMQKKDKIKIHQFPNTQKVQKTEKTVIQQQRKQVSERQLFAPKQWQHGQQNQQSSKGISPSQNFETQKLLKNPGHQHLSLPELKTVKFDYKIQSNPYNPQTKTNFRKAERLLRITKPNIKLAVIQQTISSGRDKQKSVSTAGLVHENHGDNQFGQTHTNSLDYFGSSKTQSSNNIVGNRIVDLNNYTEQQFKVKEGQQYSDAAISTSIYSNLSGGIKPKQLLNRFLHKVNSSASGAEHQTAILNLSKIQFLSANSSICDISTQTKGNKKGKKGSMHHRQEMQERRAKVEALYQKQRPSQIGFLRSNLNLPRIEDIEGPSFLMACRSYQKAVQFNSQNSGNLGKNEDETIVQGHK